MGVCASADTAQGHLQLLCLTTELFATEGSHLRILRVLDLLFYQRMRKESLLSREELALLFPNLPDVIEIHSKFCLSFLLSCEPSCSDSTTLGCAVTSLAGNTILAIPAPFPSAGVSPEPVFPGSTNACVWAV